METNDNNKVLNVPPLRFPEFTGEWAKKILIDLVKFSSEKVNISDLNCRQYISTENMLQDFQGVTDASNKPLKGDVTSFHKGDILISNIRPYLKKVWMANKDGGCSSDVFVVIPNKEKCIQSFLYYIIANQKFIDYVMSGVKGMKMPRGDKNQIILYPVSLPTCNEQKKIASFLQLIDKRIELQNAAIKKLQSLIRGLTDELINARCDNLTKFENLYEQAGEGGTPPTSSVEYYNYGEIPFIKIDDLSTKYLTSNKDFITQLGMKKSSAWLIPANSIVYSNGATIGAISINKYPVCTKQGILGIVPKTNVNVEYLYYLMTSTYFKREIERIVTEGTMRTAYLKDINNICCPLPNVQSQEEIAHLLKVISDKVDKEQRLLNIYNIQKKHLLRQLFI